MKIALIRKKFSFHGGAEKYVAALISELKRQGHQITLFCAKWEEQEGLDFVKVPIIKISSFFSLLSFAFFSCFKTDKKKFDIVHSFEKTLSQDIYRAGDGCHIEFLKKRFEHISFLKKLSIIVNPFHIASILIEKHIFKTSKHIIAISKMGKNEIISNYKVPEKKITVIYNGVDSEKYSPKNVKTYRTDIRKKFNIDENDFLLLFVGSGFTRKGLPLLLNSLNNEKINKKNIKLLVAGKEKKMKHYQKTVKDLNLDDRVIFSGPQPDIEKIYAAGDCLVMPAIYEPFGNVALEAMATGIPVIASKNCGSSEIIEKNQNGFTICAENPTKSIADNIAKTIENIGSLKEKSRKTALNYTIAKNASETIAIYKKLS